MNAADRHNLMEQMLACRLGLPSVVYHQISNPNHTNRKNTLKKLNPTAYQPFLT